MQKELVNNIRKITESYNMGLLLKSELIGQIRSEIEYYDEVTRQKI